MRTLAHTRFILGTWLFVFMAFMVAPAFAQDEVRIIKSHGLSVFGTGEAGDLKYPRDFPHLDYVNPNAPKGGTFSTWGFGTFDSMTPYILKGQAASLSSVFFETMMAGTADETDSSYGLLAHTVEYPSDFSWVIFHIRPEAQFSDGTPVRAEDAVFSLNVLREKGRPIYKTILDDFESVEALDPLTVKYTFKKTSNNAELPLAAAGLPVFSKAYYADKDFAESTLEPPLGSGPYLLEEAVAGKKVSYKRNPNYWGRDLNLNIGRDNFDRIVIEYYTDYTSAFEGFKGGNYNFRIEHQSKIWATSYNFPALEKGWVIRKQLPDGRPSGTQGFWFNMRKDKFQDPRVRRAIGMMFNFEWSNKTLFYGLYRRTDSFWENSDILQATGMPSAEELAILQPLRADLPESVFTEPAFTPKISTINKLDRALSREAGALLDAAGWTIQDGKRRNEAGETLTVEFLEDSPSFERIINPYIENLNRLGIEATLLNVDSAQATERTRAFDYDIVIGRFSMSQTPGIELRSIFSSESADTAGSSNLSGLANPAIDALLKKIETTNDRAQLTYTVHALDRALRAMHIWVPQWYNPYHNIAYLDIYEHPETLPPFAMGEADFWWFSQEKYDKLKEVGAIK